MSMTSHQSRASTVKPLFERSIRKNVMIELPPDVEDKLREKAARHGQNIGDYLRLILEQPPHRNGDSREIRGNDSRLYPQGRAPWSIRIGSYACLHYLRRIAARLWAGNGLPAPCYDGKPTHDPVLRRYYKAFAVAPNLLFAHLSNHADDCGYYLPVPFDKPLEPGFELVRGTGSQRIGSSFMLLEECAYLADFLELPLDLDPKTVREVSLGKEKGEAVWERYSVESFVCAALYTASTISAASGYALVFF
jgi:hypothetical protein